MNIVMIGPVYPYRGGIAHYTSLMVQELSKKHDVTTISYKLQYPKILYPRSSQKDYESTSFKIENTHYLINTVNPMTWLKTANYIKKQNPDLVIVQWWHPFFAPAYTSILRRVNKHSKIIFLCHNVFPHEKIPLQKLLTKMTLRKGNAYIVQSQLDEDNLQKTIPGAKYTRTVMPTFNAFNLTEISQSEARSKLDLDAEAQILLFFGFVREYKGLKHLLNVMPQIADALPGCKLLIVGDILNSEKEDYKQLIEQTGCSENIILVSDYVPDTEVENYFAASDLVVMPYESATQSGIAQIAFGFYKPVVATDVGGLPEVITNGKTGYLVPPFDHAALSTAVIRFFEENKADEFKNNIKAEAHRFSWEKIAEIVEEFAGELIE